MKERYEEHEIFEEEYEPSSQTKRLRNKPGWEPKTKGQQVPRRYVIDEETGEKIKVNKDGTPDKRQFSKRKPSREQYQKMRNNNFLCAMQDVPGDETARAIAFSAELWNMEPFDASDPDEVVERISDFFQLCVDYQYKPPVAGMAQALGMTRNELNHVIHGNITQWKSRGGTSESVEIVKKAYKNLNTLWEIYFTTGQLNPACAIFLGKNNFGYRDVVENVNVNVDPAGELVNSEELKEKYLQAVEPEDVEID